MIDIECNFINCYCESDTGLYHNCGIANQIEGGYYIRFIKVSPSHSTNLFLECCVMAFREQIKGIFSDSVKVSPMFHFYNFMILIYILQTVQIC